MDAADRLKFIRKELKLTQENFAISIGLKRDNVTSLELRKVKITTLHALAIEYVHGVNKEWLLHGDGPTYKKDLIHEKTINGSNPSNVTVIQHRDLVARFKNPEKGLENNEHLLGIENASEELYDKVSDYLKTTHETATIMKKEGSQKKEAPQSKKKQGNGD